MIYFLDNSRNTGDQCLVLYVFDHCRTCCHYGPPAYHKFLDYIGPYSYRRSGMNLYMAADIAAGIQSHVFMEHGVMPDGDAAVHENVVFENTSRGDHTHGRL